MRSSPAHILIMIFLCGWTAVYSQTSLRLYPYRMDPRKHPDYSRYHVKSPDRSVFGDTMQFISLRDLSAPNYKDWIDQWVHKDRLGNILWPAYPFIYQPNLKEVVGEIKKQKLYLFDLWGYVPGSGPGGYWQQYTIPDGVLDIFEAELGNHWLGMDNGEQDGRYAGSFAPFVQPMDADRKRQYFNFQRHFQKMGDELGNKLSTLVSLNFGHYFLKEGIYALIGAETAQGLPNSQVYYAFIRGAGKQYGVSWFGNASVWNRWGYKTYSSDATNIDNDYGSGGPLKGTSLSLLKRLMYNHVFYNCLAAGFEGSMYYSDPHKSIRETKLSPIGKIQQEAVKWTEKYGDPGIMYTPVAIMTDFFSGWSFPRHLYSNEVYKVWGNLPYKSGDYLTDNVLDILYPGYQDASYYRDERGFITPTPFGDMADCLLSDAPAWVLNQYPLLVIAGELQPNAELNDKLETYVQQGGHLVITSGSLKNLYKGIGGIKAGTHLINTSAPVIYKNVPIAEQADYALAELSFPDAAIILQHSGNIPAVIQHSFGKGKITVLASPFGIANDIQAKLPVKSKEETPLDKPYPVLNHVKALLQDVFASVQLFETNPGLSYITCVKNKEEYSLLISNDKWMPQDFTITAKNGEIVSIEELKINEAEMQAVGYTPKVVQEKAGKNLKKTIAGGGVRVFRIRLKNVHAEIQPEVSVTSNPKNRTLFLHDISDIKEEILSRPTFFSHYDRVLVDWRYLHKREKQVLKEEAGWISLQKLKIAVDLSSGLNLYPDLRLVNNDSVRYNESMAVIKSIIDKMKILGADKLLLTPHRSIENNISGSQQDSALVVTFQALADYAASKGIDLVMRASLRQSSGSVREALELMNKVNRKNFSYAPSMALLLMHQSSLQQNTELLKKMNVKDLLLAAGQGDMHNQLWNINQPLSLHGDSMELRRTLRYFKNVNLILDVLYDSPDSEYEDVRYTEELLNNVSKEDKD